MRVGFSTVKILVAVVALIFSSSILYAQEGVPSNFSELSYAGTCGDMQAYVTNATVDRVLITSFRSLAATVGNARRANGNAQAGFLKTAELPSAEVRVVYLEGDGVGENVCDNSRDQLWIERGYEAVSGMVSLDIENLNPVYGTEMYGHLTLSNLLFVPPQGIADTPFVVVGLQIRDFQLQ